MSIEDLVARDPRYRVEAYVFINDALAHSQRMVGRKGHVTGRELSAGCRRLALERYGRLARAVLNSWGLFTTDDFGNVVYNLIAAGLMSRTEEDSIDDFHDLFDLSTLTSAYRIPRRAGKH
ncbi:hypothetical protein FJY71_02720 [candidate division WOR-3 bacterium]|nr:hypothetical protein [candidate division WOR-3 bacterium]